MFTLNKQWFDMSLSYRIPTGGPNKGKRIVQLHCVGRSNDGSSGTLQDIPLQSLEIPDDVKTMSEFFDWFAAVNRLEK